jgi:predicted HicB family RNase H-like nuclease
MVEVHARMPTAKVSVSIRITPEQYEAWLKAAAAADAPSLNQWIQRVCDAAAGTSQATPPRKRAR